MIKNKRISKITMLTCLMLAGVVNAQEFYTCVPKKSWWKDTMSESIKSSVPNESSLKNIIENSVPSASDIANAVKGSIPTPTPQKNWELIKTIKFLKSFDNGTQLTTLEPGDYKFKLKFQYNGRGGIYQNTLSIKHTSYLNLYLYSTSWCKTGQGDIFLIGYDRTNSVYIKV